ncbi:DUF4249 domain-containing protein [Gemmatimonas sp.]|uniref:DUF4249 domain-containing protein n=1 Tax=Gemmatimonas sp. TaxID=1962908 RepID=UPI00286B4700|nr:DUF4249 domain-containing protein [Gemmatimonas sp.]
MRTRLTILGAALLLTMGCERVVDITVPTMATRLVVSARLELVRGSPSNGAPSGRQVITLSTSAPYFETAGPPPARGAEVRVTDSRGMTTVFREQASAPGVYVTDSLVPVLHRRYTLRVRWNNESYEGSDSLLPVAPIDSFYFVERTGLFAPPDVAREPGPRATIDFRDPSGVENYYVWDQFVDGKRLVEADTAFRYRPMERDAFFNGALVRGYQPYSGVVLRPGQTVRLRHMSLSEQGYRFYLALNNVTLGDGSPFSTPPASVRGNVANLTRPGEPALGYFLLAEVDERTARVP